MLKLRLREVNYLPQVTSQSVANPGSNQTEALSHQINTLHRLGRNFTSYVFRRAIPSFRAT